MNVKLEITSKMENKKVLRQRSVDKEKEFARKKKILVSNLTKILKKEKIFNKRR